MLVHRDNSPEIDLTSRQVIGYIEELAIELDDLAAKHGRIELAASLSIVAVQAGGLVGAVIYRPLDASFMHVVAAAGGWRAGHRHSGRSRLQCHATDPAHGGRPSRRWTPVQRDRLRGLPAQAGQPSGPGRLPDHGPRCTRRQLVIEIPAVIARHPLRSRRRREGLCILVAEDHAVNRMVACGLLERMGYQVDMAENGRAAFTAWQSGRCDLILMDCQMPEMDGYETTRLIRQHEAADGAHSDCRAHRARHRWRRGGLPRCRHGRLLVQAHRPRRTDTGIVPLDGGRGGQRTGAGGRLISRRCPQRRVPCLPPGVAGNPWRRARSPRCRSSAAHAPAPSGRPRAPTGPSSPRRG